MRTFSEYLQEQDDPTYRGGKGKDWVSADDYDPKTPYEVSPDYKTVLKWGGQYLQPHHTHRYSGYKARESGQSRTTNPHKQGSKQRSDWYQGWDDHHFINNPEDFPGHEEHEFDE
jgi:ribosome modulation factor